MASSSSLSSHLPKYEVFLSFRGADTRDNFTSHLYAELGRKNINAFIDNKLDKGHEISPELDKAIEDSMIYVIIFSENYASSRWCLDELTKILECKEKYKRDLIPVFYKVDPSTVRHQKTGSYADAFVKHEKRFPEEVTQNWKDALTKVADLTGWDSNITSPESMLVDAIVKDIIIKLNTSFSSTEQAGFVGIGEHIAQIESLLQLESEAVRIIGIWGMGGIGKSTLARALYDKLATQFGSRSCVINAQQEIERVGIDCLHKKYLSELLEEDTPSNGLHFAVERVKRTKVLLILDDVNKSSQIKELIGGRGNFGQGSRIIVTSRDRQVLKNIADDDGIYQVKEMNDQDSRKLFNLNAFKQICPKEGYEELVEKFLKYAQGIPLALNVLGALLLGKKKNEWKSQLEKLEKFPEVDIFNVLKLSYDGLDVEQKDIFLDIACFFLGYYSKEAEVVQMLDACGFSADIGMNVLKDRGLISSWEGYIEMHDLIQEMGREIVRKECPNDPGKRSRLWKCEEINQVLRNNKGTDAIQCIRLGMGFSNNKGIEVQLHREKFKHMPNLRMLHFQKDYDISRQVDQSYMTLSTSLESLPDGLKILEWNRFPQKSLPVDFSVENLVILKMQDSFLEQLWDDNKELPNLRSFDLSYSCKLIRIPNFSKSPKIEEIILFGCESLTSLPIDLCKLKLLRRLDLHGCSNLEKFPEIEETMENLAVLELDETEIQDLPSSLHNLVGLEELSLRCCRRLEIIPSSIGRLTKLCKLHLTGCESLETFPSSIFKLKLTELDLTGCSMLETFPEILEPAESFAYINLNRTAIHELPSSLHRLVGLEELDLRGCRRLEIIPSSIGRLTRLCKLHLTGCESLETFPSSIFKLNLTDLDLTGCSKLETFPMILEPAESFAYINLNGTAIHELPSSLHRLVGLEELDLRGCRRLEIIPSSIGRLTRLCKLHLTGCESLETFPSSIFKLKLTKLDLTDCSKLKTFPEILEPAESFACINLTWAGVKELPSSLDCLVGLQTLCLKFCHDLESLPTSIGNLNLLSKLDCSGCCSLKEIPNDIGRLTSLRELSLQSTGIVNLPESIAHLSSLKSLYVSHCRKLECIPQLPPFLERLFAVDCPSIRRVMPNSRFKHLSDSKEGTFLFYFISDEKLDPSAKSDVVADARIRITEDAYRFVFYSFPGCRVPDWFPYRCKGNSVTVDKDSLNSCNDNKIIGFVVCVVLGLEDMNVTEDGSCKFDFRLTFESDGRTHILPEDDQLHKSFKCDLGMRDVKHDQTYLWKYYLMDSTGNDKGIFHAHNITFDVSCRYTGFKSSRLVKECGICPLYTKQKDDSGGIDKHISRKLNRSFSSTDENIIGIDKHIAAIQPMLQLESAGVRIIGIWGMGGIGKSTLAREIHNNLATRFSSSSCILNAQQEIERVGIDSVRKKYLSELLEEGNTSNGVHFSDKRLKWAKVLLILDDVKNSSQIQELIGGRANFSQGSRIIVTSRDLEVLKNANADAICEVKEMNYQDSRELFSLNAFKQNCPMEVNADLVEKVLQYAKGVPLALKVLGSLLYGRPSKTWKSELQNLEKLPDVKIFSVLKLSYDGLDRELKDIFLDITCFYAGDFVNKVVELLESCGFSAEIGMNVLRDRGLISFLEDRVVVHDLILEMGIEIVRQECVDDPGKRSRLWKHEEIYHVLRKNKGTDAIQCIFLDMCRIKKVQLYPQIFKSMPNIRMLHFHKHSSFEEGQSNVILPTFLESLPDGLKVLHWDEFPQRSLPLDFHPKNLVKLEMRESRLEQLWGEDQALPNLKTLDLSDSWKLIRIPDLSKSPNIEEIILSSCESLTSLPINLCKLKLLRRLYLSGCSNLKKFPEIEETMENLAVLVLDQTALQELPSSFHHLVGLEELSLEFCSKLEIIPTSIGRLTKLCKLDLTCCESLETFPSNIFELKLTKLDLFGCSKLKAFPEILEPAESFAHINLSETACKQLPSSLDFLVGLQTLSLDRCADLGSLPNRIGNLNLLSELDCSGCGELTEIPNDVGFLSLLKKLSLRDTGIVNLPESIVHLSSLEVLDVSDCIKLKCIPQLPPFLKQLLAFDCPSIKRVMPNSRFKHPSNFKEGIFKLYFTSKEEQNPSAHKDVVADSMLRITDDAYRTVFYCFPGSATPYWFRYHCKGNSVTVDTNSLHWSNDNRLIGFAMYFVLQLEDMNYTRYRFGDFRCRLIFESDGRIHILPIDDQLNNFLYQIDLRVGHVKRDHTFIWKYYLTESASNDKEIFHAHNITLEISNPMSGLKSSHQVKECGIFPLYTQEKEDIVCEDVHTKEESPQG